MSDADSQRDVGHQERRDSNPAASSSNNQQDNRLDKLSDTEAAVWQCCHGTNEHQQSPADAEWMYVVRFWPPLPQAVRKSILCLVQSLVAAQPGSGTVGDAASKAHALVTGSPSDRKRAAAFNPGSSARERRGSHEPR